MADDTHALSPLNPRPVSPGDADYDAILNAFLETSRGRWFLGEYARRNRNADTHMVLAAVERIEASFALQQQMPAVAQAAALPAIIDAVAVTKSVVDGMAAQPAARESLDLIQRGAKAIRDISWTLRECGADARICDLIDVQVKAISEGCESVEVSRMDNGASERIQTAFGDLTQTIEMLVNGAPAPAHAQPTQVESSAVESSADAGATDGAAIEETVFELDDASYEAMVDATSAAILGDPDDAARPAAISSVDDPLGDLEIVNTAVAIDTAPAAAHNLAGAAAGSAQTVNGSDNASTDVSGRSLGHALLASGLIAVPDATPNDPLAPFRRMSQADKIAFFT